MCPRALHWGGLRQVGPLWGSISQRTSRSPSQSDFALVLLIPTEQVWKPQRLVVVME